MISLFEEIPAVDQSFPDWLRKLVSLIIFYRATNPSDVSQDIRSIWSAGNEHVGLVSNKLLDYVIEVYMIVVFSFHCRSIA